MHELLIDQPTLFIVLGYPGAGKTFFSRQFAENSNALHLSEDRIRFELFDEPQFTQHEDQTVFNIFDYLLEIALSTKQSVVVDGANYKLARRKHLRDIAKKSQYNDLIIWVQTDLETAFDRASTRDRRHVDDKFSHSINREVFDRITRFFKRPQFEDYVVISGKHVFRNQMAAVVRKVKTPQTATKPQTIQPTLPTKSNLLGGRVDLKRRALKPRIK